MPDYKNPKVAHLIDTSVADFTPRDFLDLALAALDQASLRTALYNRAYAAVEAVISDEKSATLCGANVDRRYGGGSDAVTMNLVCALLEHHDGDHNTCEDGGGDSFPNHHY